MTFMEVLDGTIVNVALPTLQVELGVEATFTAFGAMAPTRAVPRDWFLPDMRAARVLGLASGGGQQMPLFAAMGAVCTVLDYSERQIASERMVAEREGYEIRCVRADMTRPLLFEDGEFDLNFHPVSNCYAEDVLPIWRECFCVLAPDRQAARRPRQRLQLRGRRRGARRPRPSLQPAARPVPHPRRRARRLGHAVLAHARRAGPRADPGGISPARPLRGIRAAHGQSGQGVSRATGRSN
ncbi:class I SAM-dependent methyltransferase [Collinsella intestinalis]|uniref:class I SAM-dependent methyltransferase n=1 Tax=Collinsella intestinalis TaxID=147207 RepID=UPI001EF53A76|nr:methyltransferase domain-containing protein [Collinsella intestinalis]